LKKEFIEQAKVGGQVQQAIDRAQLRGVNVVADASRMWPQKTQFQWKAGRRTVGLS
jgi:hypothetical protein